MATSLTKNPRRERGFFSPVWPRFLLPDTADFRRLVRRPTQQIFVAPFAIRYATFSSSFEPPDRRLPVAPFAVFESRQKFTNRTISGHF
ncbi:hypothetical protein [Paraburkholderia sediminicola]|uniref:hypothetical protein n=1 Tax=Paraburkholderia sediminicola TaxID=458836 RepID=UPI0015817093|nr:hypothetical protein [Paraburkholderia sediminicola]